MPKAMHRALSKAAKRKGLKGRRRGAYVYGTLKRRAKG